MRHYVLDLGSKPSNPLHHETSARLNGARRLCTASAIAYMAVATASGAVTVNIAFSANVNSAQSSGQGALPSGLAVGSKLNGTIQYETNDAIPYGLGLPDIEKYFFSAAHTGSGIKLSYGSTTWSSGPSMDVTVVNDTSYDGLGYNAAVNDSLHFLYSSGTHQTAQSSFPRGLGNNTIDVRVFAGNNSGAPVTLTTSTALPTSTSASSFSATNVDYFSGAGIISTRNAAGTSSYSIGFTIDPNSFSIGQPVSSSALVLGAPYYSDQGHYLTQGTNTGPSGSHKNLLQNDIDLSFGNADIVASAAGQVTFHSNASFGNYAIVDHGVSPYDPSKRLFTLYAHLESVNSALDGAFVLAGTAIGIEGKTGRAAGIHVHFGVYSGDPSLDPYLNPGAWTSVGINGSTTVFDARAGQSSTVTRFTSGAMFDQFVCGTLPNGKIDFQNSCILHSMFSRPNSVTASGTILQGQQYAYTFFSNGQSPLNISLVWPGSELLLNVYNPLGTLLASLSETDGLISFTRSNPLAGLWSFSVTGIVTAPGGEPFSVSATSVAPVPLPATGYTLLIGFLCLSMVAFRRRIV